MKRFMFRVAVTVISLVLVRQIAGLAAILFLAGRADSQIPFLMLAWWGLPIAAGVMALMLAGFLLRRRIDLTYVPVLAVFVLLLPIPANEAALNIWFSLPVPDWFRTIMSAQPIVSLSAMWLGLGAFLRFSSLFDQASLADGSDMLSVTPQPRTSSGRRMTRMQWLSSRAGVVWAAVLGLTALPIGVLSLVQLLFGRRIYDRTQDLGLQGVTYSEDMWWLWAIGAVLFALSVTVFFTLALVGVLNLRDAYRRVNATQRLRMRWLILGGTGSFWFLFLGVAIWFLVPSEFVYIHGPLAAWLPIGVVILVLLAVYMGVFYDGVVDPALAIKRSTVYGALGVIFVVLFAGVESLFSELLEARLGLTSVGGAVLSGSVVALTVIPFRGRVSRWADRWMPKE